jgi:plastocyanin
VRRAAAALLLLAIAAAPAHAARRHRPYLPPPAAPPLGHSLTVDESEWAMRPSKRVVAAGTVRLRVYNRGEDDHNVVIVDGDGVAHVVALKPGEDGTLTPRLAAGRYHVFCSLQAGTPESHEARGMWFTLEVR